ncbi:pseudouridine synthase [Desulfobotulus sp.]|jgi:23S rRNA pseudouridine2605 synthase/23S rRNA pseudouridine2604 synthase|uniref:pseudouridine synthase n=1 Tax=Desulfobotulus sp. TaxID=1940337 RepID=UPI002A36B829|nr:pseudouridine synthase [Desulfobotulus sp.]MDY0164455.1 pseudouridine synthase [Desulfobotulus sp.]
MPTTDPEHSPSPDTGVRLQKFLADAGLCSRREAERRIAQGRVRVNGLVIREMGFKVQPGNAVSMDDKTVQPKETLVYVLLHKPAGVVTSCHHRGERVVTDLVPLPQRIFPVGRLDKDSTGLLLLTNDGPLHHRLSHPSFDHEKEYVVQTRPPLNANALAQMAEGILLDGRRTRPARVYRKTPQSFGIILREGRNRQIRRMVAALGAEVQSLHRIRMAFLQLKDLAPGKWRYLHPEEILRLKQL